MIVEATVGLGVRIHHPDGRSEQLTVDAERALVGSAAHCEVRLPAELAAAEHLEIVVADRRIHLSTRPGCRTALVDGALLGSGPLRDGATIELGGARIVVSAVDLTERRKSVSPYWFLAPVPVVLILVLLFVGHAQAAASMKVPPAPALFDAPQTTCPAPPNEQAGAFAAEKNRLASGLRERGPFSPSDAVASVALFETASACYTLAKQPEDARESAASAKRLRERLEEEYHVRRIRLEHYLKVQDPFGSDREAQVLLALTAHRPGAYHDWLSYVGRFAKLEVDKRGGQRLR